MPSKLQTTVEMVAYTAKDICSHPEVFTAFLETAAHNYKYGFRDQMLIFSQKPNATACAEIEVWNKLGRYVNRGTKGIALLVDRNVPYRLRHVFDIADTNSFHGNEVKLWQMKPEYEEAVTEALENSFGEVDNKTGFADVLLGISELIVSDNFSDYCEKLKSVKHGSFLEEVDDLNTEVYFRGLLKNSVAYMLLTRCGYDAAEYLDAEDFRNICNFNTVDTLNIIGCANRDISEMVLREVAETVRAVERESKASNRTFEKTKEIKDNITENKTLEGSIENGTDLQERGRLPSPEHSGTGSSEDREIWDAAAHISAALPQDDAVGTAAERKTERAPRTNRPSSERDDGNSDERNGEVAGSERRTQGEQPNEMGSDDEQHQSVGGGNGAEGHRLQLSGHNYNGPSEVPYYHDEDEKAELLRNCIALKDHRKEIATFIAEHEDRKECGNFIKGFFDNTYVEHILDNGQRVGYRAYDDLLTIWKGSYLSRESDAFISWERVANKIYGLILTHEWLSPDEQPLPTVGDQFRLFEEASAEKANQFTLPQEAIDYVLRGAGNISQGRLSTYDQFLKQEGKEKNIAFLKNGYGIGGGSDAIPESGYWESHDGKGIKIYKGIDDDQKSVVLPWNKVEKRIGELIEADRYLTAADKEAYPKYKREKMLRNERYELMREFRSIYEDYNDFERQLGNESAVLSMFELGDCASQFMNGEKRCHFVSGNPFVLPTMRDALHKIIDAKTHLTERAEKMLEALSGDLAKPLEPSYDELNPPPEPEKEYRFSLGDTVHIGADEYSILSIDDKSVLLNNSKFPLLCEEMKREEFDRKIAENPMNDKYLQVVESVPEKADGPLDNEKIRITLDSGRDAVHWIYYNPDSDAGGLYVSGDLAFSVFEELVEEYDIANHPENAEKFFSDLEEMSDQFLAEINTPFFLEAEDDYESDYDYIEFTPENILSIHNDILELNAEHQAVLSKTAAQESQTLLSASEREAEVLESVLNKLNIGDIKLAFEDGELVAADGSSNVWRGKQFYDFLVEDAISYDEYGKPNEIDGDVLADFTELCGLHGVEVKDYNAPSPWDEYEKAKKENPDAVVMQKVGDFFEMFGEEDTKIAHEVLDLTLTKKTFTNKSITTPMCGFPLFKTEEYTQKILDAGYDVVVVIHEPGEKLEVRRIVSSAKEKAQISLAPPPEQKKQSKITPSILYPEIKSDYRTNFRIDNDDIGTGTPLDRFYNNFHAIGLLKKLESEHRLADTNEQRILSNYVGWGGLPQFFEETNPHYEELKSILPEDDYASARESALTAFYTPPVVIKAIYKALGNMNFKSGNILEPSCGIGNFMGLVPDSMSDAKFYGIELDSISGRIAQRLYQKNSIAVQGFENTNLPDSFFDAAIGNVPFGQFKVPDKRYDKHNFLIHDYFFARTLDKVRPGGIIAFITSKGTMDKENPAVRKYIAQRADLLGAIRLPNNTFKDAAGTDVTSDIIFLQKRDRLIDIEPEWVHLNTDENGITMNSYFVDNPDMIMGEMRLISGPHGPTPACIAYEDRSLAEQLSEAVENIHAEVTEYEFETLADEEEDLSIPAEPDVRNFSYTIVDGKIYYRENSRMNPVDVSVTAENRIKGMIGIRDCVRTLIEYQTEDFPDSYIENEQKKLNELYDAFSKKYGLINSHANNSAFNSDSSYCLLSSLEILDDEGNFLRKADMFSKRTIKQKVTVTSVDTASEALALSLAEKTKIDIEYMCSLTGKSEEEIAEDLKGVIFLNPRYSERSRELKYLPADEYLSGNIREKLNEAKTAAEDDSSFEINVKALTEVMPKDLSAGEISVRLGATWIPPMDIERFMFELFGTARYISFNIHVHYSEYTGEWNIEGKSYDRNNVKVYNAYGTNRINGYKIIEETLNLRDVRVFDYVEDENGNKKPVLNKNDTAVAQGKQQLIKDAFADWIWKDQERRDRLTKLYNEKFNSVRPREYNGEHLNFVGMNPEITLRPHQVNAIAHILYGGNTLLAHVVGAGKTFEMVAAAQESKRLGLCNKSLFVVPNHLTEQWAAEYLQLYPSANILVASKKDFETKNRKKFCGRIATGDYDSVIIGHSQLEKIPMSVERQQAILNQQLEEIMNGISELKRNRGENFSIKQLEKAKKTVKQKLEKLNDQTRKDDIVTFEELGVDRLFVDEAHYYKNLAAFTKMRNVGGISQIEAQKSSDLYMKCRYLDELTGGKGVVFATGTPISNSMVELYTMQKYLEYNLLRKNDLLHFDSWASTFGETVTAIELAPEGSGYRPKTRFAKFYNLPELMSLFKETADIQTADMLDLPVPKANYHNVLLKPSEQQKEMVQSLAKRAEKVRNKMVNSSEDNMLLITNDGRKLALDGRLINEMLPDSETGKVSACADNVFDIWQKTAEKRSTQMVFCDLSTPHGDGSFNVYDDLRDKLIAKGIPKEEIAYIHSANSEAQKKELFGKVRNGQVRVLIGSTQKMGAGTNVQQKLIALHHLDCPWRPSDLQQREGRIVRQGNENPEVDIYTYVTENTFDSYLYQLVESKQKFIGQIMTSKSPVRSAEDVDEQALSYAEIKALCTGNPYIKEKMDLDIDVSRLKLLKANHLSQIYSLEDKVHKEFPAKIAALEERIKVFDKDIATANSHPAGDKDNFCGMTVKGVSFSEKKDAGEAIIAACKAMTSPDAIGFGSYRGFDMELSFDTFSKEYKITLIGELRHTVILGTDIFGNILRLDNAIGAFSERQIACKEQLEDTNVQLENAKAESQKPFPHEEELKTKSARLAELNTLLDMDKRDNELVDGERDDDAEEPDRSNSRDAR